MHLINRSFNYKLYFNYNANVKKRWAEKQAEYIQKANKNWPATMVHVSAGVGDLCPSAIP